MKSRFPTMRTLALGVAAGAFLTIPSASINGSRQILGHTVMAPVAGEIVGFQTVDGVPVTVVRPMVNEAVVNEAQLNVGHTPMVDDTVVEGLRPVASQLAEVAISADDYTKEELLGLAIAAGVEVSKSWNKSKIVEAINGAGLNHAAAA